MCNARKKIFEIHFNCIYTFSQMAMKNVVLVKNLAPETRERDLYDVFDRYGRVLRINHMKTYALITYEDHRDAGDAVRDMDGKRLEGNRIHTSLA